MSQKMLKIVVVKVGEYAKITEIPSGLESLQSVVGGLIEASHFFNDEIALISNEEGKINGMPYNRVVKSTTGTILDVIAGDFFIIGSPSGSTEFASLSDELAVKYRNMFLIPQNFASYNNSLTYYPVAGNTELEAEELAEIVQSFIQSDASFGEMKSECAYLTRKLKVFSRDYLIAVVENGLVFKRKVSKLLMSLEENEGCNLFYYDEEGENNSAYPITDKVTLAKAILDELPLTEEAHKQNSNFYKFCKDEAEFQLTDSKKDVVGDCDADTLKYLIEICADALYEGTILDGDAIDDIIDKVLEDHSRGNEG